MRFGLPFSLVPGTVVVTVVLACQPNDMPFDARDFERATGFTMPPSAHLLKAETRNWDRRGDHDACAIVEMSQTDFDRLRAAILEDPGTGPRPALAACSQGMYAEFARYAVDVRKHSSIEGGLARELLLVKDRPIVLVQYSSW